MSAAFGVGVILIGLAVIIGIVVVCLHLQDRLSRLFEELIAEQEQRHVEELERVEQRAAAYIVALEEQHTGHRVDLADERARARADLAAEREQWARLFFARNAVDYGTLTRVARTPDEALGQADVHRAEAMAGIRRPHVEADDRGEPMIPIGMG